MERPCGATSTGSASVTPSRSNSVGVAICRRAGFAVEAGVCEIGRRKLYPDSLPAQLHGPQGWHMSNDCYRNLSQSNLIHITVLVLIRQPRSRRPVKAIDPVDFFSSGIH